MADRVSIYRAPMRARDLDIPPGVGAEHGGRHGVVGIGPGSGDKAARMVHRPSICARPATRARPDSSSRPIALRYPDQRGPSGRWFTASRCLSSARVKCCGAVTVIVSVLGS